MDDDFYKTSLLSFEKQALEELQKEIISLLNDEKKRTDLASKKKFFQAKLKKIYQNLSFWEKTLIARHPERPYFLDYSQTIFDHFIELHGDRYFGDDKAIIGGLAKLESYSVMLIGHEKGRGQEKIKHNFGMANPEGYRKALRLFQLANKYQMPIVTLIDTPGAYPGIGAEERGQSEAIAKNIQAMFSLEVPVISVIIGEGGSGGALGISVGNHVAMLQYSIYSVISPESCASILWRDANKKEEAATALKNDSSYALKNKVIDEIIQEPLGGAHRSSAEMSNNLKKSLLKSLKSFEKMNSKQILSSREKKFAGMGL